MASVIAHRGHHITERENTTTAFAAAVAVGADGVELDVRRTADGALVIHHDPTVSAGSVSPGSVSPDPGSVSPGAGDQPRGAVIVECRADQLPSWMPTLAEALAACEGLRVNVELKELPGEVAYDPSGAFEDAVVAEVDRLGWLDRVWFSSFWPLSIERIRAHPLAPRTGLLLHVDAFGDAAVRGAGESMPPGVVQQLLDVAESAAQAGHQALHPQHDLVGPELIDRAHELGLEVHAWTVNDVATMKRFVEWGIDGVMTDDVVAARTIVDSRAR